MSRLPGFGYASLLALVDGPFFSEQTCCGEGRGFFSKCAKCSLQRRAVVKGQPIRGLSETRGTAGGRLGCGRCLRSAGRAPMT